MGETYLRRLRVEKLECRHLLALMPSGADFLVNESTAGMQFTSAGSNEVAILDDNSLIGVFAGRGAGDRSGVFLRRYDGLGDAIGLQQLVNTTTAGLQSNSAVGVLPSGGFVVAWNGRGIGDREGVYARWYDGDGSPLAGEVLVNKTIGGAQSRPQLDIALDGSVFLVWQGVGTGDFDGVFARRFSASGVPLSDEILINTTIAREQAFADIEFGGDGTSLVTWSSRHQDGSDWGVYGQRLGLDGIKLGAEFRVNSHTAGSQMAATVEALDSGFAVAWQSRDQDGDGWGVYGQQLNTLGGLAGAEFRLNADSVGFQNEVALAGTGEGNILAAWTDGKPDGTGWNVKAREIDLSAATPMFESEFVVHPKTATTAFGHQRAPSVAANGNMALMAWSGDGAVDHDGVYLQRYSLAVNVSPNLAPIPAQTAQVGVQFSVNITATDGNAGDTLTYLLDPDNAPAGATIEKLSNSQAIIHWTPLAADLPGPVLFRALVSDSGLPPLFDVEDFQVTLTPTN